MEQAFDNIRHDQLQAAMQRTGTGAALTRAVVLEWSRVRCKAVVGSFVSDEFEEEAKEGGRIRIWNRLLSDTLSGLVNSWASQRRGIEIKGFWHNFPTCRMQTVCGCWVAP